MNKPYKILLADGQYLTRKGMARLIDDEKDCVLMAETSNSEQLFSAIHTSRPDIIILDYQSDLGFNIDDIQNIINISRQIKIMVATEDRNPQNIYRVMEMGVLSFLTKSCDKEEILNGIQAAVKGEKFVCSKIVDVLIQSKGAKSRNQPENVLSKRESEIVRLIGDGLTTKEIAERLYLSPHTVNTHRKNILKKLNLKSTAHMVLYGINAGIIRLE